MLLNVILLSINRWLFFFAFIVLCTHGVRSTISIITNSFHFIVFIADILIFFFLYYLVSSKNCAHFTDDKQSIAFVWMNYTHRSRSAYILNVRSHEINKKKIWNNIYVAIIMIMSVIFGTCACYERWFKQNFDNWMWNKIKKKTRKLRDKFQTYLIM